MSLFFKRLVASFTAGTLAFSAVPAFALGLNVDSSASGSTSMMLSRCKQLEDDDHDECERRVKLHIEAKQNAEVREDSRAGHGEFMSKMRIHAESSPEKRERMWDRAVTIVEHSIKRIGTLAKKVCRAENPEASAVTACMTRLKTSFKAKVEAAIEAAFQI